MPLIRRVPWTVQPQAPTRPAEGSIVYALHVPSGMRNAANYGSLPTATGTTKSRIPGPYGLATKGTATDYIDSGAPLSGMANGSIIALLKVGASAASNIVIGNRQGLGGFGFALDILSNRPRLTMFGRADYDCSTTITSGEWVTLGVAWSSSVSGTGKFFLNGKQLGTAFNPAAYIESTGNLFVHARDTSIYTGTHEIAGLVVLNRTLSDSEFAAYSGPDFWQLFESRRIIIPVSAGAGGGVNGTLSQTLGALTSTATGLLALSGTASQTLSALTSVATGTIAIAGAASPTLAAVTSAATGALALKGTATQTLEALTLAGTGQLQAAGTGALAQTLANASLAATGALAIKGAATPTLGALTSAATGTLALAAALSRTLDAATLNASGVSGSLTVGTLSATLADVTASATGRCDIAASLGVTLGDLTVSGAGRLQIAGGVGATLSAATLVAAGAVPGSLTLAPHGSGYRRAAITVTRPGTGSVQRGRQ